MATGRELLLCAAETGSASPLQPMPATHSTPLLPPFPQSSALHQASQSLPPTALPVQAPQHPHPTLCPTCCCCMVMAAGLSAMPPIPRAMGLAKKAPWGGKNMAAPGPPAGLVPDPWPLSPGVPAPGPAAACAQARGVGQAGHVLRMCRENRNGGSSSLGQGCGCEAQAALQPCCPQQAAASQAVASIIFGWKARLQMPTLRQALG